MWEEAPQASTLRRAGLFGNHLREAPNNVERILGFVGETGSSEVHFLQAHVQFRRAHEPDLEFRSAREIPPRHTEADHGNGSQQADEEARPQIASGGGFHRTR